MTVSEGLTVCLDRNIFTMNDYYPDWLIYTDASGSLSGGKGIVKLAFELDIAWV